MIKTNVRSTHKTDSQNHQESTELSSFQDRSVPNLSSRSEPNLSNTNSGSLLLH